ncbi:antibiotic biosynthesis monooxygenase [bacterium AH-315-C07]|nr:antibiotic biosynthesis monooxygenase [bacterium AH-315-C07]
MIASTPSPPYYTVIFTSVMKEDISGYEETADRMIELAKKQPGFLGVETAREEIGITVSYWKDLESIKAWKMNDEHSAVRQQGKSEWYRKFKVRIALVEKEYEFISD